jgi:hypothetical protein
MPDLDGGHYFLTALLPIDNRGIVEHGGQKSSPVHMVREALETLPTALQSPASEAMGIQSPFVRSLSTHFVRLVVLDEPFYNGRDTADSILSAVEGTDLLKAQPVDNLACPFLLFVADFDPAAGGQGEPRAWLEQLWSLAAAELTAVFQYCYGFDTAAGAAGFASFVIRGQVETTMPFNDYWTTPPPFPSLNLWLLAPLPALAVVIAVASFFFWPWWASLPLGLVLVAAAVWADYAMVMAQGAQPLPTAPNSTLKDVLKALYLQQAFSRFAVAHQGSTTAELRAAFADFAARHRPGDVEGPTQAPGVIRSLEPAPADA